MRRSTRIRLLAVGALAAVIVVAWLLLRSGGEYQATAVFDQVNGLVEGGEVLAGGLRVGTVQEIELGPDGYPRVRMAISSDYPLRRGASADLRALSLSGEANRYVMLRQGSGPELAAGATLPRTRTDEPVELDDVLSTLDRGTRAEIRALLDGFDRATAGRGADIDQSLRRSSAALGATADFVAQLRADGTALRTLVERGHQVASAIAVEPSSLGATADQLSALLGTTAARGADLASTIELMPGGLRTARTALDRLGSSVSPLRDLVRAGRPGVEELAPFLRDLRPVLRSARPALVEADALLRQGPADLRALDGLLRAMRPLLRPSARALEAGNPMLDQFRVRLPDAFGFISGWADFTASYDANGHGGRVGLVYDPTPTREIEPADSGPGRLRLPFLREPGVLEGEPWTDYEGSFVGEGDQP